MSGAGLIQSVHEKIHPVALYAIQKLLIILLLAFTPPTSLLRFAPFPILLFISFSILPHYHLYFTEYADMLWAAGEILMGHLEYLEKLLLSQWSFQDQGPSAEIKRRSRSPNKSDGQMDRLKFALWAGTSHRYIGTRYQSAHTPPYYTTSPSYVPSRIAFLLRKALVLFSSVVLLDLIALSGLKPENPTLFKEERLFPPAGEMSITWAVTRMRATAALWLGNFAGIQMYYSALTAIGVALWMTSPAERRPVFGSITDAYTLRGYWGQFWHQLMRKKLSKPARYIVFTFLGLPRPSTQQPYPLRLFVRYLQLFLVYLISGLFHQCMDQAHGIPFRDGNVVRFFMILAVGITLEDLAQWAFKRLQRPQVQQSSRGEPHATSSGYKILGYTWVFFFLSWTTPLWLYPRLRMEQKKTQDFGLVRWLWSFLRPVEQSVVV